MKNTRPGYTHKRAGQNQELVERARLLAMRLERLSADSHWAHKASGLRGALLRCLDAAERELLLPKAAPEELSPTMAELERLTERGYMILYQAARAIRTPDTSFLP